MSDRVVVHSFQEKLDRSNQLSDEPSWIAFYRRLWPDMIAAIRIDKDSQFQRWGVDREVLLPNGKRFTVDEKKREKDYGDLLIEEWSVGHKNGATYIPRKVGWSIDPEKRCDFVAYAIPTAGKCFMLPFELTRQTCIANLPRWKTLRIGSWPAYPKDSPNEGYWTRNCAVQWAEFQRCLCQQMLRQFGAGLSLPGPIEITKEQMVFEW